jgi:hypothetical protein
VRAKQKFKKKNAKCKTKKLGLASRTGVGVVRVEPSAVRGDRPTTHDWTPKNDLDPVD